MTYEVGHAVADDCIRALGKHITIARIDEVQAYVAQLMVYDSLDRYPKRRSLKSLNSIAPTRSLRPRAVEAKR
jgi:hypothetical protein